MYTTQLRKVGGSLMLAVPPAVLETVGLGAGDALTLTVENGCLMLEPQKHPTYTLQELLAQCDPTAPLPESADGIDAWPSEAPQGREFL